MNKKKILFVVGMFLFLTTLLVVSTINDWHKIFTFALLIFAFGIICLIFYSVFLFIRFFSKKINIITKLKNKFSTKTLSFISGFFIGIIPLIVFFIFLLLGYAGVLINSFWPAGAKIFSVTYFSTTIFYMITTTLWPGVLLILAIISAIRKNWLYIGGLITGYCALSTSYFCIHWITCLGGGCF